MNVSDQVLLRDLVAIPDEVHVGDFVLGLAQGVNQKSTITDYVVTDLLARDLDRALGVIKSAIETNTSRAAYLDGSFGSGKSHFMAVLYAILKGDPDARGKIRRRSFSSGSRLSRSPPSGACSLSGRPSLDWAPWR